MKRERLCNGTVHPVADDDGMTLYEHLVAQALNGLAASGELIEAGRRAEQMANDAIDAMMIRRYGDKHVG